MYIRTYINKLILIVILLALPSYSMAAPICELVLQPVQIKAEHNIISVNYGLVIKPLEEMRNQLRDGAQLILRAQISVSQINTLRPNTEIYDFNQEWHLNHDPLSHEFVLSNNGKPQHRNKNLNDLLRQNLQRMFVELKGEELDEDENYKASFIFSFSHAKVPPWLEKALLFWSWELADSLNYEQNFTYPAK